MQAQLRQALVLIHNDPQQRLVVEQSSGGPTNLVGQGLEAHVHSGKVDLGAMQHSHLGRRIVGKVLVEGPHRFFSPCLDQVQLQIAGRRLAFKTLTPQSIQVIGEDGACALHFGHHAADLAQDDVLQALVSSHILCGATLG